MTKKKSKEFRGFDLLDKGAGGKLYVHARDPNGGLSLFHRACLKADSTTSTKVCVRDAFKLAQIKFSQSPMTIRTKAKKKKLNWNSRFLYPLCF